MISKIKSILNYYQIDLGGIKSEKMTKNKKKEFLDRFNANYDAYTVLDILDKIKERFPDKLMENPEDEMNMDEDMENIFGNLDDHTYNDDEETENEINPFDKKQSKAIDEFINWISSVLYSANHKVIITKDGLTTNIKLVKIKGGKKK